MIKRIALFFLFCTTLLSAQQAENDEDLRVGLVLSGGGARAIAQLGALKAIHESGIRIDYVGGTSMGAIFGALYSMGYSPDEITKLMTEVDWAELVNDEIPRQRLSYNDKKNRERYALTLALENGKINLPQGLNSGYFVVKNLNYLTQAIPANTDFRELPIPFFCTGTHAETGALHVFEQGNLSDALRASTALPSLFIPHRVNGGLYIDGGVKDNFPVSIMRDMPVDFVLGVDVQSPSYNEEDLNSVVRILQQISTYSNLESKLYSDSIADLVIRPDVQYAGLLDFHYFMQLYEAGYLAAIEHLEELQKIAARQKPKERQALPLPKRQFQISNLRIEGNTKQNVEFFERQLKLHKKNTLRIKRLERMMDEWQGAVEFAEVSYHLENLKEGEKTLVLRVNDSHIKTKLRAGLHYDDDFGAAVLLNITRRDFLLKNSHFSFDFAASDNPRTWIEYSTNLGPIPSLGIKFRSHRFRSRIYEERDAIAQFRYTDYSLDLFLRSTLWESYSVGGGIQFDQTWLGREINVLPILDPEKSFINYYGFMDLDTYDRSFKPGSGLRLSGMYRIIAERNRLDEFFEPTPVLNASFSQALSYRKVGLEYWGNSAFTIGPDVAYPYNIFLGGLGENYINYSYPFLGYRFMELIGRNMISAGVNLYWEFHKNQFFTLKGNWGKLDASFDGLFDPGQLLDGYGVSYGFPTPIGPLEINVMGSSNHSSVYTYFNLGYWF